MFKFFITTLLCGVVLLPGLSNAISRIGGGNGIRIYSDRSKVVADLPVIFNKSTEARDGLLMLQAPRIFTNSSFKEHLILAQDLDLQMPDLRGLELSELEQEVTKLGYERIASRRNACIIAWLKVTPSAQTLILTWGIGSGLVVTGTSTPVVYEALQEVLKTAQVPQGACGWN